ncbi:heterokaryon incompatibility protein-domain-containing protein, partial [Leptodontidium sp. 2 PMI_412]
MMYHGDWSLRAAHHSDLLPKQALSGINPRPNIFTCNLAQREEGTNTFQVEVTAAHSQNLSQLWELKSVVLVPIDGESQSLFPRCHYTVRLFLTEVEDQVFQTLPPVNTADSIAKQALSWIEECQASHENCRLIEPPSTTWKPTRLIYTGQPDIGIGPRLCLSSDLPADTRYVTLSHCWGSISIFSLLSTNINSLLKDLPLAKLTQVFRDAIDLARRLDVAYIWIDSLCIIQDSVQDWRYESALMGNVYKYSWCNIAATGFENGLSGIYVRRNLASLNRITVNLDVLVPDEEEGTKAYKGHFYCMENFWDVGVSNAPLNQRAWVYQERLLSPRVLHLGSNQAFWECVDTEACETFPRGLPAALSSRFKIETSEQCSEQDDLEIETEMLELWWQVVRTYNRGRLTKYEDKLIAMAGVAKEMQVFLKDKYIAGLWGKHLLHHLTWVTASSPGGNISDNWGSTSRPLYYQAPSWSWASI